MDYIQHMNPYALATLIIALLEYVFLLWLFVSFRIRNRTEIRKQIQGMQTSSHGVQIYTVDPRLNRSITKRAKKRS